MFSKWIKRSKVHVYALKRLRVESNPPKNETKGSKVHVYALKRLRVESNPPKNETKGWIQSSLRGVEDFLFFN